MEPKKKRLFCFKMVSNFGYIRQVSGILKSMTIVLLAAVFVLACVAILGSEYTKNKDDFTHLTGGKSVNLWREIFLLVASAICLIVSTVGLLAHLIRKDVYWNRMTAIYDFLYHVAAFLFLGSSGILTAVSAVEIFDIKCTSNNGCQKFELKLLAGGLAMISALLCGVIGSVVLTNRKVVERDNLLDNE